MQIPGESFSFDLPYYTNKIGELVVLLELEQRKRMILFGAYMELKNKYESEDKKFEEVVLVTKGSDQPEIKRQHRK